MKLIFLLGFWAWLNVGAHSTKIGFFLGGRGGVLYSHSYGKYHAGCGELALRKSSSIPRLLMGNLLHDPEKKNEKVSMAPKGH